MYKELKRAPLSPGCQAPARPPCPPLVRRVSRASCGSRESRAHAPRCLPAAPDRAPATPRRACSTWRSRAVCCSHAGCAADAGLGSQWISAATAEGA
jgi:hypothetical protein